MHTTVICVKYSIKHFLSIKTDQNLPTRIKKATYCYSLFAEMHTTHHRSGILNNTAKPTRTSHKRLDKDTIYNKRSINDASHPFSAFHRRPNTYQQLTHALMQSFHPPTPP